MSDEKEKKSPLESFRDRAKRYSTFGVIGSVVLAFVWGAAAGQASSAFSDMSFHSALSSYSYSSSVSDYSSAYQSASALAGMAEFAFGVCACVASVAIVAWVAANLLIAYKRS